MFNLKITVIHPLHAKIGEICLLKKDYILPQKTKTQYNEGYCFTVFADPSNVWLNGRQLHSVFSLSLLNMLLWLKYMEKI